MTTRGAYDQFGNYKRLWRSEAEFKAESRTWKERHMYRRIYLKYFGEGGFTTELLGHFYLDHGNCPETDADIDQELISSALDWIPCKCETWANEDEMNSFASWITKELREAHLYVPDRRSNQEKANRNRN